MSICRPSKIEKKKWNNQNIALNAPREVHTDQSCEDVAVAFVKLSSEMDSLHTKEVSTSTRHSQDIGGLSSKRPTTTTTTKRPAGIHRKGGKSSKL